MGNPTTILIAGPTASGKSALALEIAETIGGAILNADAIQVYQDLNILSARPSTEDMARAPHHLYGTVDGRVRFSAGEWARTAGAIIHDLHNAGKPVIVVGGTGLYFRALVEGLSPMPTIPDTLREAGNALYDEMGAEGFRALVVDQDPPMARLPASDRQRLVRAWSVHEANGDRLSDLQALPREPVLTTPVSARGIVCPPREILYARCDQRFETMLKAGGMEEAKQLLARGLSDDLPVMRALGAAELIAHLRGDYDLPEAIRLAQRNTRRFAKRQMTWFRQQTPDWPQLSTLEEVMREVGRSL